jgi:D-alanyl-lipoteichoic acid acyltransferase DltB (MBOAT superfamily)
MNDLFLKDNCQKIERNSKKSPKNRHNCLQVSVFFVFIFLGIEILRKLNKMFLANISGVYITKTKISKTFSISLSKNG